MQVTLYNQQGQLGTFEWLCVACGSPEVKDYSNYCRCAECHSDHSLALRGYISDEEYRARCVGRRVSWDDQRAAA